MHYCIVFVVFYSLGSPISGQSLPPKYVKNLSSFGFFRGYRNGTVAWKRVKLNLFNTSFRSQLALKSSTNQIWWKLYLFTKRFQFSMNCDHLNYIRYFTNSSFMQNRDIPKIRLLKNQKGFIYLWPFRDLVKENIDCHLYRLCRKWLQLAISANITHL